MLKVFRNKNVAKAVLWMLLILILPAFVLWGSGSLGGSNKNGPTYAGTIENKRVSFDDFARSISSIRCQVILNYFNNAEAMQQVLKNKSFVGKLAWDRLIMLKKTRQAKIKVSDQEVVKFISSHPLFLRDGRFDDRVYEYFLKNSLGLYPRNFEELVRENLMIQKLTDAITKDVKITDDEVLNAYKQDKSKVTEAKPFSQEIFNKEKEDYAKLALENKKNAYMEGWLREHEKDAILKIDLNDYDKYYK